MKCVIAAAAILGLAMGEEAASMGDLCQYSDNECQTPREGTGMVEGCQTLESVMASMSATSTQDIKCDNGVLSIKGVSMPSYDGAPTADEIKSGDCVKFGTDTYGSSMMVTCTAAAPCFARDTMVELVGGDRIPMSDVTAGDYVLPGPTRVVVNQHKNAAHLKSSLLKVDHAQGSISLTPDHVLNVDGSFVAARNAVVGSKLGNSEVSRVTSSVGGIINPLTTSGMVMADGVLATTYPEWIAGFAMSYPTYLTAGNLLSFLFPATTQAYYDAHLEHFFQSTVSSLKGVPAPFVAAVFHMADLLVSAGLVVYTLASLKAVLAIAAVVTMTQTRK